MTDTKHPDFIPPWQDMPTLCRHICASPNTVDSWVKARLLPPPRRIGGKQMWDWSEVHASLSNAGFKPLDPEAERIRNATKQAETHAH